MKKRLFSWLLVLAMVLSMMPTVAFATEGEEPAPVVIFSEDFSGYETGATYDPEAEGATLIPYDGDFTITNAPDILGAAKILRVSLVGDYNAATNDARLMLNKIVGGSFKLEAQVYGNGGSYYTDVTLSGVQKGGKAIIVRFYNNGNIATVADGATTVFHAAAEDIDADGDLYEDNDKAYTNLTVIVDADAGTVNIATKRNGANGVTEGSATIEGATVANGRVIFDIRTKNGSTRQARFDNIKVYCLHAEGDQVVTEAKLPTCAEAGASTGVVCDRCDTVLEEPIVLDPLTHDLVQVGAQAPTKETAGWDAYEYCNNCDYTTYAEIPALGSPAVVFSETFDNDTGAEIIYVPTAEGAVLEPYNKNESNFVATPEPRITAAGALAVFLTGDYASGTNAARLQLSKVVGGSYELGLRVYGNAAGDHTRVALTGATKNDAAVELRFYKNGAVTLWNGTEHAVVYEGNADDKTWADLKFTVDADAGTVGVLCTRGETVLVDTTLEEVTVANGRLLLDVRGKGEAIRQARFDDIVVKCLHAATDVVTFEAQDPTCTEPGTSAGEKCDRCETVFVATETTEALGHTLVQVEAQAPTTEAIGWEAYEYCTACDYTTYVEIPKVEVPESAILFKETFDYEAGTYDPTAE